MQKRILSLLLVLCMVLSLVPSMVLPLLATDGTDGDDTTTGENTPAEEAVISYRDKNGVLIGYYPCHVGDEMPTPNFQTDGGYDVDGDGVADEIPATVTGSMTLKAITEVYSRFDANYPTFGADISTTFKGNWKTVKGAWNVDYAVDTVTPLTWTHTVDMDVFAKPTLIGSDATLWKANGGGFYSYGKFVVRTTASLTGVGAMYTAPFSGTVDIGFTNIQVKREGAKADSVASEYFAILLNGQVIWPATGTPWQYVGETVYAAGTITDDQVVEIAQTQGGAFPTSITVNAGDQIVFVGNMGNAETWMAHYDGIVTYKTVEPADAVISYRDKDGVEFARYECKVDDEMPTPNFQADGFDYTGDGVADTIPAIVIGDMTLTAVSNIYSRFDANYPTFGADIPTTFKGDWKTVKGNWNVDYAVDTVTPLTWTYTVDMDVFAKPALIGSDATLWKANGGGFWSYGKFAVRTTASLTGVGAMYTVPQDGVVDIGFTSIQVKREGAKADSVASEYFAILLNGQVIWPATGTPWQYVGETVYAAGTNTDDQVVEIAQTQGGAFPTNITVSAGDQIVFVGNMGNAETWMAHYDGIVTYKDIFADATVEAGVSLGEAFGVDYYITPDTAATEYGVVYNEEKIAANENGIAAIKGIAAKELGDEIVVTPYQMFGETCIYGEEITVTVAELLYAYVEGDDAAAAAVAIAMLNYGAAAQTYFDYKTFNLVNTDLTDDQKTVTPTGTYVTSSSTALDGATVELQSVTLLLEDNIALKLVVDSKQEGLKMQIATDAEFTNSTVEEMELTADETGYKLIGEIETMGWNTLLYFRVVDAEGNAVSRTIAYSVTAYCGNMAENTEVNGVTQAILALYDAVAAYTAE